MKLLCVIQHRLNISLKIASWNSKSYKNNTHYVYEIPKYFVFFMNTVKTYVNFWDIT